MSARPVIHAEAPFHRALERVTFAMALLGLLALSVTGEVGPLTFALGVGLMLLSRVRGRLPWLPSVRQWNLMTVFALGFCVGHWRLITGDLLPSIIMFTVYLQVLRLFSSRSARHVMQVFVISFAMILLASVLTTSILFLPLWLAYGLFALMGLVLLTIRSEAEVAGPLPPPAGAALGALIDRRWVTTMAGVAMALFALTVTFFFLLPRYQGNDWLQGLRRSPSVNPGAGSLSGYGDSIRLGQISRIRQDRTIAMRAGVIGPGVDHGAQLMGHLRLRGQTLNQFLDGQRWLGGDPEGILQVLPRFPTVLFARGSPDLTLEISQERGSSSHLFGHSVPASLTLMGTHVINLQINYLSEWMRLDGADLMPTALTYRVSSQRTLESPHVTMVERSPLLYQPLSTDALSDPEALAEEIQTRFYAHMIWEAQRQIRPNLGTRGWEEHAGAIRAIAAQWAAEARGTDPVSIANAIERRLHAEYAYSLEPRTTTPDFPVLGFLTETREGHCEYFASAMVLMLRSLRIPARLATGYLATEWNGAGNFYVVRERDAHAWVEMYAPDRGWLTYDPTPPGGRPSAEQMTWMRSTLHWLDANRHSWYRWVIDLGVSDQRALYRRLGLRYDGWRESLRDALRGMSHWTGKQLRSGWGLLWAILGAAIAGAATLSLLMLARRVNSRRRGTRGSLTPAALLYRRLLEWLGRQGHVRPPGMTPAEFARIVCAAQPRWAAVERITALYYRARYAPEPLPDDDWREARRLLVSLTG
jgi:protein-glutamine gamma-glutamyltransferase